MSGRGHMKIMTPSSNPIVTIGLTLSTSSSTLSLDSNSEDSFFVIITARILTTPYPDRAITISTHLTPLDDLTNRSFKHIVCTTKPEKRIAIYPTNWPHYLCDSENLASIWPFITIPAPGQGVYTAQLEIPRDKIKAANLEKGEKYRVKLSNMCLGTRWWSYGSLEELNGVRFRLWEERDENGKRSYEPSELDIQELREEYGDGPVTEGEKPTKLAMVPAGDVEFDIV